MFVCRYNNSAFAESSSTVNTVSVYNYSSTASFRFPDSLPFQLQSAADAATTHSFSFQLHGHLLIPVSGNYTFNCSYNSSSQLSAFMWINDHLICPSDDDNANISLPLAAHSLAHIRVEVIQPAGWLPSEQSQLDLVWALNAGSWTPIPSEVFVACLTDARLYQWQMKQRQLALGWENLNAYDLLSQTLMPHSLSLTLSLYQISSQQYRQGWYVERAINGSDTTQQVRIGNRTWTGEQDHPFTSLHVRFNDLNISVQTTTDRSDNSLSILVQGVLSTTNYSDYRLVFTTSYLWGRSGNCHFVESADGQRVATSVAAGVLANRYAQCVADGIDGLFTVYGSETIRERSFPGINQTIYGDFIAFAFPEPTAADPLPTLAFQALASGSDVQSRPQSFSEIQRNIQHASSLPFDRTPSYTTCSPAAPPFPSEQYNLVQTSLAWLSLYTPFEGIVTVVSRRPGWNFGWGYTLFEWDSFVAVHMMASFTQSYAARQLALATYMQIVKAKVMTPSGFTFTPNYVSGTVASRDRTEPPLAAKVLDEIVRMWSGASEEAERDVAMMAALVFDDLVSEVEWFRLRRRVGPAQLIALGSDPNPPTSGDIEVNDMQAARYESGLDNSPMYDQDDLFDSTSHHMQLYDVGMTSLYLAATLSLQSLANLTHVGDRYVQQLQRRYEEMAPLAARLWSADLGIYVNVRVSDSSFQPRLSPTSFFSMLALLPSVADAERMMAHLTNTSEFCVSADCVGQPLPSISRSDASYGDQQYWRGRQWGPHTMIVYWSLSADKYSGSALIDAVRRQLVVQASGIYRDEWRLYHHVHENYDGDSAAGCNVGSSDPLYTWYLSQHSTAQQHHSLTHTATSSIAHHRCAALVCMIRGALNAYVSLVEWRKQVQAIEAAERMRQALDKYEATAITA